jgi:hypothetical protein
MDDDIGKDDEVGITTIKIKSLITNDGSGHYSGIINSGFSIFSNKKSAGVVNIQTTFTNTKSLNHNTS